MHSQRVFVKTLENLEVQSTMQAEKELNANTPLFPRLIAKEGTAFRAMKRKQAATTALKELMVGGCSLVAAMAQVRDSFGQCGFQDLPKEIMTA